MTFVTTETEGLYFRVGKARWNNPLDPLYAARFGQRWNPRGMECLYFNKDIATARANVLLRYDEDVPFEGNISLSVAPVLWIVELPESTVADLYTDHGLAAAGLSVDYPFDEQAQIVSHAECQQIGLAAYKADLSGVDCRSAATGGNRELAWFPRGREARIVDRQEFAEWW